MPLINNYILIFCFILPGTALFMLGIFNSLKIYRLREIVSFPMLQDPKTVNFTLPGCYCLIVVGGNKVHQLPLRIVSQSTNKGIDAYSVVPAPRSFSKGRIATTYCRFLIQESGQYTIIVPDYSKIIVQRTFPGPLGMIANSTIPPANLYLTVKEYIAVFTYLKAIIGTIIGILIASFGIILLLFNNGFIMSSQS